MAILYEYDKWLSIKEKHSLLQLLKNIWYNRKSFDKDTELKEGETDSHYQPFLQFDENQIRANNYVGFIQNGDELIEIFPKIFRKHLPNPSDSDKVLMLRHIFYWFNYCRKWNFPFNQASLDTITINKFPELIINLFANQFLETLSNQPLNMYQEVEESLQTPRGSINFKRYINNSLINGNFQNIECDYEPFLFDNKVNRIIKHCTRLLLNQTTFSENIKTLQNVLFILDEVEDIHCSIHDFEKFSLNSFYEDYNLLLDSCKLILNQKIYSSNSNDLSQWCLLFPMEYIFEDFLAGFLEQKFSKEWKVEYQKSNEYLSNNPRVFNLQHDIFLTSRKTNQKIIIDTKYKLRPDNFKLDPKKGISQTDLYQMLSYAFKRGCTDIILVYPNLTEDINVLDKFEITSGFEGKETVTIYAVEIPFYSLNNFSGIDSKLFNVLETTFNVIKESSCFKEF